MADILLDLLAAINTRLTTEVRGGSLTAAKSFVTLYTTNGIPPVYGQQMPSILVEPLPVEAVTISIPGCMVEKRYPIQFSVLYEGNLDRGRNTAATLLDSIETEFFGETFSLSQWVDLTSKTYTAPVNPPYEPPVSGVCSLVFTHVHTDIRALP